MEKTTANIPKGWAEITLGDILKYEQPYKFIVDSTEYDSKSGIPVLTAGKSFLLGYTNEATNIYNDFPVIIFDDFTTDSKFVDFPFKVKSSAMKFLKPKNNKEQNINFFFEVLQSLKMRGTFSDHKRRWISEFSKIKTNSPLFNEQTRIAQILSKADQVIVQTKKLIDKYQSIKTGLLQDLLTKGIDEQGKIRNEITNEFKDSALGRIPKEWNETKFSELDYYITSGSRNWAEFYSIEGALFLRITNLTRENINFKLEDLKRVDLQNNREGKRTRLQEGDLLISITADLGIIGVIPFNFEEAYINQHIALFRIVEREKYNPRFLGHYLSSAFGLAQFAKLNDGGAKAGLNLSTILKIKFPKMSIAEQDAISMILDKSDQIIKDNKTKLYKLQSLKSGMMRDLLSGKVRVKLKEEKLVTQ